MKKFHHKPLNQFGMTHLALPAVILLAVAAIGYGVLGHTHRASAVSQPIPAVNTAVEITPHIRVTAQHEKLSTTSAIAATATTTAPTITNNWAGYAVLPSSSTESFTNVAGNWTQPGMTCSSKTDTEYAPQWIGLDGWSSTTVEQAGVTASCKKNVIKYQAFIEDYPNAATYLALTTNPVKPGDVMYVSVSYTGVKKTASDFTIKINDTTAGWTKTVNNSLPTTDGPFGTSGEWITEDLGNAVPNFKSVVFSNVTATDNSGLVGGIGTFTNQTTAITDSNGLSLVSPSALNSGVTSFSNNWYAGQ